MMRKVPVRTWEEFELGLRQLRNPQIEPQPLLFRGHAHAGWPLATTLERWGKFGMRFDDYYRQIVAIKPEIETLTNNSWRTPPKLDVETLARDYDAFSVDMSFGRLPAYAYMAYLRHHGFPSPLLDWTRSPYVAAYFALRGFEETGEVSIFALARSSFRSGSPEQSRIYHFGPRVKAHRRHFLQQSEYTICVSYDLSGWRYAEHEKVLSREDTVSGFELHKFDIPASERIKVLTLLEEHNLNAYSLFGSEEALMETMGTRSLRLAVTGSHAPIQTSPPLPTDRLAPDKPKTTGALR
jgi:hypothetical protein